MKEAQLTLAPLVVDGRGDWERIPVFRALAVVHPRGGYTVALPPCRPGAARYYHGNFPSMDAARAAARAHNKAHNL